LGAGLHVSSLAFRGADIYDIILTYLVRTQELVNDEPLDAGSLHRRLSSIIT